jgi:RIO kinase 1
VSKHDYSEYESMFDPMQNDRKARRARKTDGRRHQPKKSHDAILSEMVEAAASAENTAVSTYRPSRFEEGWLLSSLRPFYQQELITDVLAQVKGGKEASVYRCAATPNTGFELAAAKVYRPRMFRQLRNDKMYREGRGLLSAEGQNLNQSVHADRIQRAVGKKTSFGQQVSQTSWLMYEYTTLGQLYQMGAAVPKPLASGENAILMEYIGDEGMAAPLLSEVDLHPKEVRPLFDEVLRNIELMLQHHMIHGDLSAYNILYWEGKITLIDFPQVTNSLTNRNARFILARDIERICDYFADQGVERDPDGILRAFWNRYQAVNQRDQQADESRLNPDAWM